MLRWPTSELPIWPGGSPTAGPDASSAPCGNSVSRRSKVGVSARLTAFPAPPRSRRLHETHDARELLRVEAGAADENPVDVGLRHQFVDGGGLHAAPVEDCLL